MKMIIKIQKIIAFAVFLFLFIYIIISIYNVKMIEKNKNFTIGTVIDKETNNNSYVLVYKYEVDSVFYEELSVHSFFTTPFEKFYCKKFLVVYDKNKPQHSILLITKAHYEKYNLVFPDSLLWLLECK